MYRCARPTSIAEELGVTADATADVVVNAVVDVELVPPLTCRKGLKLAGTRIIDDDAKARLSLHLDIACFLRASECAICLTWRIDEKACLQRQQEDEILLQSRMQSRQ